MCVFYFDSALYQVINHKCGIIYINGANISYYLKAKFPYATNINKYKLP